MRAIDFGTDIACPCAFKFVPPMDKVAHISPEQLVQQVMKLDSNLHQFAASLAKTPQDVEDLVQDTYLKVMQYSSKYSANTNLKAWVYTIMKNTYINAYRRKMRAQTFLDDSADSFYLNNSVSDPCDAADLHYFVTEINEKILEKNEDQRKPFEMYLDGYKYQEIADVMNLSMGTVKSRIYFIRQKLMADLKDYVTPTFPGRTA